MADQVMFFIDAPGLYVHLTLTPDEAVRLATRLTVAAAAEGDSVANLQLRRGPNIRVRTFAPDPAPATPAAQEEEVHG